MKLTTNAIRSRLSAFIQPWREAFREEADAQIFTLRFLECYGLSEHHYVREGKVPKANGSTGYMDGFIPGKFIIEFKSLGKNLKNARQQAEAYRWSCPVHEQPRYILLCDFQNFVLCDLKQDTEHFCTLADLPKHADWFRFLIEDERPVIKEETEADRKATELMARLHEALLRSNFKGRDLEVFLTRLLFCLFADDTEIFGDNSMFLRLLEDTRADGKDTGAQLTELFEVLNTPVEERSHHLDDALQAFCYVNGKLFAERTRIPSFDADLRNLLLDCARYDWKTISPAIFGSMFQGVLDQHQPDLSRQASRRELGAHYTSERNILRAINPLFMDDLRKELQQAATNRAKLTALYDRLPTIRVLDPACGCGNFLVVAYRELRLLEMDVIERLFSKGGQSKGLFDISTLARVSVNQFYGIEIDASAAHIAQVAMWITDHQMNQLAALRFGTTRPSVPLVDSPYISQANALRTDWSMVLAPEMCSFIVGNPPFLWKKEQSKTQKEDLSELTKNIKGAGVLDYVAGWYLKAVDYMQRNSAISTAFVSTNSITQGEQVGLLWGHLLSKQVHIRFAHRTFKWSNEGKGVAAVHCIIVGIGLTPTNRCRIFDYEGDETGNGVEKFVSRINPYLMDAPDVLLLRRSQPLTSQPKMIEGITPLDNGILAFTEEEKQEFLRVEPTAKEWFKPWLTGNDFINGKANYCLWLTGISPVALRKMPYVMEKVSEVKKFRENSKSSQKFASTPWQFRETSIPSRYIFIPKTSSEKRKFFPVGFVEDVIATNSALYLENGTLYHFGMLCSTMHNAWLRTVGGRLENRYRYSANVVYNNYPWPQSITENQYKEIELSAEKLIGVRSSFPNATFADLYDPLAMPVELIKAHAALDKAVDNAYGYKGGKEDASRVAFLFALYQQLAAPLATQPAARKRRQTTQ